MTIPDKFLWGGSISAAQCEGGWDEGGKSPVQVDFVVFDGCAVEARDALAYAHTF